MDVRSGRDGQGPGAGLLGEKGSHFLEKLIEILSYPTLLYSLISPTLSLYTISSVNISVINCDTIITLKNINSNSLLSCNNIQLVITFQGRVLSGQEHGLICLFPPVKAWVPGRLETP